MPDREKVIKKAERIMCSTVDRDMIDSFCEDVIAVLKEQEQKTGHWTTKRTLQHDGEWYCDQCEYEPTVFEDTPFCPNCGAKMESRWNE